MSHFHREQVRQTTFVIIRHFTNNQVSAEFCSSPESADHVAVRAMDISDCLYAYTASVDSRFSNLPVIAGMGAPHLIRNQELG